MAQVANMDERREKFRVVQESQKIGQSLDYTMNFYKNWVDTYEEDLAAVGYQAPQLAAQHVAALQLPKHSRILDTACGTGWCAQLLKDRYGYTDIDGLDASEEMLAVAKTRNIYGTIYQSYLGGDNKLNIQTDTYDVTTMAGGLVSGHIPLDAFLELARVTKRGGYIIISMREENRRKVPEYKNLDTYFQDMENKGIWEKVDEVITKKYYMDLDGLVLVFKVTS